MGCNASSTLQPTKEETNYNNLKPQGGVSISHQNPPDGSASNKENGGKIEKDNLPEDDKELPEEKTEVGEENVKILSTQNSYPDRSSHSGNEQNVGLYLSKGGPPKDANSSQMHRTEDGPSLNIDHDVTKPLLQTNSLPAELKADDELAISVKNSSESENKTHEISNTDSQTDTQTQLESQKDTFVNTDKKGDMEDSGAMEEQKSAQADFQTAIRCSCSLLDPETVLKFATDQVTFFQLNRTLPHNHSLSSLLSRLPNLQELDISGNNMGPQPFRLLMLAMAHNKSITWLNASNNMTDTDSAECIGIMLNKNRSLLCLDISGNYLGKDYFSRCVGPALSSNDSLLVLRCESIGSIDLTLFMENVKKNKTLQELNISHNQLVQPQEFTAHLVEMLMVASHNTLLKVIMTCLQHILMTSLNLDDTRVTHPDDSEIDCQIKLTAPSRMETLSLANCSLANSHLEALLSTLDGSSLCNLRSLNLSNNPKVTVREMAPVVSLCLSGLKRLNLGLNDCQDIELLHRSSPDMKLTYLNLRKSKVKYDTINDLHLIFDQSEDATLVLDGIRFSGSGMKALKDLLVNFRTLSALSLGGCCLSDGDTQLLCDVINSPGLPLHMLKLAANRISDKGVNALMEALVSHASHPLKLIDLSDNQITSKGAIKLGELFKHPSHQTQVHSLNVSRNNIDPVGLKALASLIGQCPITCLHLNNQSATFREEEVDEICEEVAKGLGMEISKGDDDDVKVGCAKLESLPPGGFLVKLTGLAGESGPVGKCLDSAAIPTDYSRQRLPCSSLQEMADLAAYLLGKEKCEITSEEWDVVINAKKEFPEWLKVPENFDRTVFLSHLPSSVTVQKMEGVFENEVDCDVTEVYLLKDPISRKNNGFAWALLGSNSDVEKAMGYMNTGQAQLYSQPYVISPLNLKILSDSANASDSIAEDEIALRKATRRREEEEHRALLRKSYVESQDRHAYRLAHPAYADGRIW